MYLLKCKCGCLFTLKAITDRWPMCPDCKMTFENLSSYSQVNEVERICNETGLTLRCIPDDAKISVTFDP